jgi:hypothetical protein
MLAAKETIKSCHMAKSPPSVAVAKNIIAKIDDVCYTESTRKSETCVMREC